MKHTGACSQWRCFLSVCIFLILCSGCAEKTQEEKKRPSPFQSIPMLQFQVNTKMESDYLAQARQFAEDVETISNGDLLVGVTTKESVEPSSKDYDLTFLENMQMAEMEPTFSTFSMPFLYDDADHLSKALNNPELHGILVERLKGNPFPLAALSSKHTLLLSLTNKMVMPGDYQDLTIAIHEGQEAALYAFQALGTRMAVYSPNTLLTSFLGKPVPFLVPGLEEPVGSMELDAVEADMSEILAIPQDSIPLYVIDAMHQASPVWLVVKGETWENLTDWERAVLQEAVAGLVARFEENRALEWEAWTVALAKRGISVLKPERQALSAVVYETGGSVPSVQIPAFFDMKLFELVESY